MKEIFNMQKMLKILPLDCGFFINFRNKFDLHNFIKNEYIPLHREVEKR